MTVREMRKLLKKLPEDMEIMMQLNSESDIVVSVCKQYSEVQEIEVDNDIERVLFLVPCSCNVQTNQIEIVENPN
jgi:hypothetical protein